MFQERARIVHLFDHIEWVCNRCFVNFKRLELLRVRIDDQHLVLDVFLLLALRPFVVVLDLSDLVFGILNCFGPFKQKWNKVLRCHFRFDTEVFNLLKRHCSPSALWVISTCAILIKVGLFCSPGF